MWELCKDSSQYLLDLWGSAPEGASWQAAKRHFAKKGYVGEFILIHRTRTSFRLWKINIKK